MSFLWVRIKIDERDERFFRRNGLEHLSNSIGLEYRAFADTKFFGKKIGKKYYFQGYNDVVGETELREKTFQELVNQELVNQKLSNLPK